MLDAMGACVASFFALAAWFAYVVSYALRLKPTERLLAQDLVRLSKLMDVDAFARFEYTVDDVETYYASTTFRDYRLLALFTGCGAMHTDLVPAQKLPFAMHYLKQLFYVMMHMPRDGSPANVLEIGFGKGSNAVFLNAVKPAGVKFFGVDVVPAHVRCAEACAARAGFGDDDIAFHLGDASDLPPAIAANTYDLIFGIESFCNLDTDERVKAFLDFAAEHVRVGGKIVIVDGFRADDFDARPANVRRAMELAESGFRLRRMPSKATWKRLSASAFVVREDIELTHEALPFWTKGWRLAHTILRFAPGLVRAYAKKGGVRTETFANLVSVSMTAYAMGLGSAEYGVLVLEKT